MPNRRNKKLIDPGLQLRLILRFTACASVVVLVQAILLNYLVAGLSAKLPHDESILLAEWPAVFRFQLLAAFALLVPLLTLIGIQASFRIAGPLRRLQTHLEALAAGQDPGPCRLRKGDELQGLCELVNRATARLRTDAGTPGAVTHVDMAPDAPATADAARDAHAA